MTLRPMRSQETTSNGGVSLVRFRSAIFPELCFGEYVSSSAVVIRLLLIAGHQKTRALHSPPKNLLITTFGSTECVTKASLQTDLYLSTTGEPHSTPRTTPPPASKGKKKSVSRANTHIHTYDTMSTIQD